MSRIEEIATFLDALKKHSGHTNYASKVIESCGWLLEEVERLRGERAAVVAWLRAEADEPNPIEAGEHALSPSGRGLLLCAASHIERGEHRRKEEE